MKPNFPTVFAFEGVPATIKVLQLRKASETDAAAGAVELKICADGLPVACMAALIAAPADEVERSFWRTEDLAKLDAAKGDQLDLRFVGLGALTTEAAYKERHELKIKDVPPIRCDVVNRFVLTPVAGQLVDISFRVIISDPPKDWIAAASVQFGKQCLVTLRQDPELALDESADDKPAAKRTAKAKDDDNDTRGDLLQQAIMLVNAKGKTSAAMLQDGLKISYERACELLTNLENTGVIGKPDREGVHELAPAAAPEPAKPARKPDRIGGAPVH